MGDVWGAGEFEALRDGLDVAWGKVEAAFAGLRARPGGARADEAAARARRDRAYLVYATAARLLDSRKGAPSPNSRVTVGGAMRKLARFEAALSSSTAPSDRAILDPGARADDHGAVEGRSSAEGGAITAPPTRGDRPQKEG